MNRRSRLILLVAAALLFSPLGSYAAEKGWFGFAVAIDADGILNPKLRSIKIDKIFPASPAAKAGLSAGDMIVEIDGIAVEGAKADTRQELRLLPRLEPPSRELLSWISS
jgi:predicted metalloprotease with PDZ domain